MKPRVRRAQASDAVEVAALLTALGYVTSERQAHERLAAAAAASTSVLVAERNTTAIGLLAAQRSPYFPTGADLLRITALVVAPASRRSGVGEALIEAAVEHARRHGYAGLELTTAEHRADAHRFYERLGFSRSSQRYFRAL